MTDLEMAEVIHKARWPEDRQMAITPFADEDSNGREYCLRIARAVLAAQSEYLTGCFHKTGPVSCQSLGGCQSEACDHYGKTEYRPRMTLLAQVDGILYPKVER